eukprot:CAMPEP_0197031134 /NCGR_PEP_ID=MMETSP1384-20130603/10224_1 /TAXON_ID=29189 /ORGANISM="Ammonia sp." /LENGTH=1058 /DNA_ID=CAMNT_0042460619 /DNA_START=34 /DNA_END=3210 /DNA_ORIENTATION=+
MYRCLLRTSNTLRRKGTTLKYKGYNCRSYRCFLYTAKRNLSTNTLHRSRSILSNKISIASPTASILCHKRLFNPNSSNPHRPNDTVHSGSIGQYADDLFERWQKDPNSVDKSWREYFEKYHGYFSAGEFLADAEAPSNVSNEAALKMIDDATNLLKLVRSYQSYGHYIAQLDPLGILQQGVDRKQFQPELLRKETWGFTDADLDRPIFVGDHRQFLLLMGVDSAYVTLRAVENKLREVYCGTIGYQYMHIANFERNQWLRKAIERDIQDYTASKEEKIRILDRLLWAEEFENFLDIKYPAQKRFGINGAEAFVPLLKEIIDEGARLGISDFVIGMPHRGRLLFLATVLRKPLWQIFYEFRGMAIPWEQIGDSGDVKYHLGHSSDRSTPDGQNVHLSLFPNPSHLEAVDPVIMGKTRAKQYFNGDLDRRKTAAIIIHGDASFSGQGVVYESMALTDLPKYTTGGVIHVIVNNQIGFTTDAYDSRSSPYCTDVARSVAAPILHVNGDDAEAVTKCAKIAVRYRQEFASDAVVDMLCFRRYGHNEGDEPMFTQPTMYRVINDKMKSKQVVTESYKAKLVNEDKILNENEIKDIQNKIRSIMSDNYELSANKEDIEAELRADWLGANWSDIMSSLSEDTSIDEETAHYIANSVHPDSFPDGFAVHRKLVKILKERSESVLHGDAQSHGIDWGTAEMLAYASLLLEGVHVRVSGQDCERGTFSHRHAVVHDQEVYKKKYIPLSQGLKNKITGKEVGDLFQISNSNLSEFGVLGFEYGYSCESPKSLTIWEAQFGDFANGAQVIFDQFISSSEIKWLRQSGLTLFLPHGYEGGGPEHSSARIERYLQMSSDNELHFEADEAKQIAACNWQIVNITSPSNFFHCLRRQVHRPFRKPLIVFTPKYGLRHPLATSSLSEFTEKGSAKFRWVIPGKAPADPTNVKKLIFCSGKVWINLEEHRQKNKLDENQVVISRVEQISPFPYQQVADEIRKYENAQVIWLQEEPKNMGAWSYVQPRMHTVLKHLNLADEKELAYIGRKPNASPATGYPQVHKAEHNQIIQEAFGL